MRMAILKVTCVPKEQEGGGPKRTARSFRFQAGLTDDATAGGIVRNGTVRAKAALGDEAPYYTVQKVIEEKNRVDLQN